MKKQRDWSSVNAKRLTTLGCAVCGYNRGLEAAHLIGRARDRRHRPVDADEIIFLCSRHHLEYDAHRLCVWAFLSPQEKAGALRAAGSAGGAVRRLCGPLWRQGGHAAELNRRIIELEKL